MTSLSTRLRALPSWQVTLGVALLTLGFLIAAQLRAEGPRIRYTTQERSPLVETALGLTADQDALKARILELNDQIRSISRARARARRPRSRTSTTSSRRPASPAASWRCVARASCSSSRIRTAPTSPGGSTADSVVNGKRPADRRRGAVARRRRGDVGQRRTDHEHDRDHRYRRLDPGELGLSRAALSDHRDRPGRPVRPRLGVGRVRRLPPAPGQRRSASGSRSPSPARSPSRPTRARSRSDQTHVVDAGVGRMKQPAARLAHRRRDPDPRLPRRRPDPGPGSRQRSSSGGRPRS